MVTPPTRPATRRARLALAAAVALAAPLAAGDPPAPAAPATDPGAWRARTAPPAATAPAPPPTSVKVRVYENFDGHGASGSDTPLALDADVGLVRCSDGNLQASGVTIGGATSEPDSSCAASRGTVRYEDGVPREPGANTGPPATAQPSAPRCDAAAWRCADPAPASPPDAP